VVSRAAEALVIETLRVDGLDVRRISELAAAADWERVVDIARSGTVAAFVWNAILGAQLSGAIPVREHRLLKAAVVNTTARASVAIARVTSVGRLFRANGVDALAIKGMALLLRCPELRTLRYVSDIDLVIRPCDAETVDGLLKAAGFRNVVGARGTPEVLLPGTHHSVYVDAHGFPLEVHEAPPEETPEIAEEIWSRSEPALDGVRVPCPEDMLGISCRHALEHHAGEPSHLFRMIADVRVLLARGADAIRARDLHDRKSSRPVETALRVVSTGSYAHLKARRARAASYLRLTRARGWRHLVPSRSLIAIKYGVSPRSPRLPFLYVRRLLEGVARLLRPGR
jgi:hypothetical protein